MVKSFLMCCTFHKQNTNMRYSDEDASFHKRCTTYGHVLSDRLELVTSVGIILGFLPSILQALIGQNMARQTLCFK